MYVGRPSVNFATSLAQFANNEFGTTISTVSNVALAKLVRKLQKENVELRSIVSDHSDILKKLVWETMPKIYERLAEVGDSNSDLLLGDDMWMSAGFSLVDDDDDNSKEGNM